MFKPSLKIAALALGAALSLGTLSAHADEFGRGRGMQGHEQSFRSHDTRGGHQHHGFQKQHHPSHHSHHGHHGRTDRR